MIVKEKKKRKNIDKNSDENNINDNNYLRSIKKLKED